MAAYFHLFRAGLIGDSEDDLVAVTLFSDMSVWSASERAWLGAA